MRESARQAWRVGFHFEASRRQWLLCHVLLKCAYAVICDFLPKRSCIVLIMTKGPVAPAIDAAKKSDAAALNVLASPLLFSNREVVIEPAAGDVLALSARRQEALLP